MRWRCRTSAGGRAPFAGHLQAGALTGGHADHWIGMSGANSEDDGVLMGYGYHRALDEGQLLIVAAAEPG